MDETRGVDWRASARQRRRLARGRLAVELAAPATKLRERRAGVIAHGEAGLVVGPFPAHVEFSGATALGRNRAFGRLRVRRAEVHVALAAGRTEPPSPGD